MTLFARSDLVAVTVSADHGGCGTVHTRPVVAGSPAKVWALDCHPCEDHLRSDALWSTQVTTIPETADEKAAREDVEKRGALEQAQNTADALAQLAKLGDLPAVLGEFMRYITTGQANAAAVHASTTPADIIATPVPVSAQELSAKAAEPEQDKVIDLDSMTTDKLRELAKEHGVRITRAREDQISVLREAMQS